MENLSQMIKWYKEDTDTPTLSEAITGPFKDKFMQSITHDIKELGGNVQGQIMCKGYIQVEGVYFFEEYSPVVSWTIVILMLNLSIKQG